VTPDLRAALQRELDRLTEGDRPQDKARFAEGFWRSVRHWDERFATDSESALRDLGTAWLARILVTQHPGSPQYAQALREDFMLRTTPEAREACRQFSPSERKKLASA
jgi:hypothetical protein